MVPKLVTNRDNVIKKIVDNPFMGNRIQIQRINRKPTNIITESDLSNVYRELRIYANENILNDLGILGTDSANISNKDFISIEINLELDILLTVLDNLMKFIEDNQIFPLILSNPLKKQLINQLI